MGGHNSHVVDVLIKVLFLQGKCSRELTMLLELVLSIILMTSLVPINDPDHILVALLL